MVFLINLEMFCIVNIIFLISYFDNRVSWSTTDLVLHYGCKWRSEDEMVYEGGQVAKVESVNIDYLSYFGLWDCFVSIGCEKRGRMWFKVHGLSENDGI